MTRLERYKAKLAEFEHRRNEFMRQGKYVQMQMLDADIDELRRLIEEAEPKPVTQLFTHEELRESGLVPAVLEVHLAADYLAACAYTIEDTVRKLGGGGSFRGPRNQGDNSPDRQVLFLSLRGGRVPSRHDNG